MQTFRQFLDKHTPPTTRDKVGFAVYYLQNFGGEDDVTVSDIAALHQVNDISMGESAIAAHLHNLEENGMLLKSDRQFETGYYLSADGMNRYERLSNDKIGPPPLEEISEDDLPHHYERLYERMGNIKTELEQQEEKAEAWRKKAKRWRIVGVGLSLASLLFALWVNYAGPIVI